MPPLRSILSRYQSVQLIVVGLILISAGGLSYAFFDPILSPFGIIILTTGIILFFSSIRSFRVSNIFYFIIILIVVDAIVAFVDAWPLQLAFAQVTVGMLAILGVPSTLILQPHFGGIQIQLYVQSAISGTIVGGEIDNACAGFTVLLPCLVLLFLSDKKQHPLSTRLAIALFAINLVIIGNFFRILAELWLPAVGIAPFVLVHYPLALVLGLSGVVAIAFVGHRWSKPIDEVVSP
ncbi:MAG: hypothetical protein ACFFDP_00045 [Promethearchaeota archaeon]